MIKTIIFDFGDVLVKDTTKILEKKAHFNKLSRKIKQEYITAFHSSEIGKLPSSKLLKVIHQTLEPQISPKEIENYIIHTKLLPPWKLALKLQKHYQIIIFSNNQKTWPKKITKTLKINFLQFPFVNSAYIGLRKPDPKFYRYLINKYKLQPKEAIFIDDKEKNLKPARKFGIKTFCYKQDYKALLKFLKNHNIQGL